MSDYKVKAWSWCADYCKKNQWNPHDSYFWDKAVLEYRRQHNIFETSDKVVLVGGGTTDVLLEIVYHKYTDDLYRACVLSTGSFGPIHKDNIRHATDAEIKAGKRL